MNRRLVAFALPVLLAAGPVSGNPIPIPPPASMPLEQMWIRLAPATGAVHAEFLGHFTFDYIPSDVNHMAFPVPTDASAIRVCQDGTELTWQWHPDSYPTVLPEMPVLPMIGWAGAFPAEGAVFTVAYEHDLIERPDEFVLLYALGTGKYYSTYQKVTTAEFDIALPAGLSPIAVLLDRTPVDPAHYEVVGDHLLMTLTSMFGPFTRDLIVLLAPRPGDANRDGVANVFDLGILASNYYQWGKTWADGDFTGDGFVGVDDLAQLANHYQPGTKGGAAVPEPATLALLALGAVALIRRGPAVARGRRG